MHNYTSPDGAEDISISPIEETRDQMGITVLTGPFKGVCYTLGGVCFPDEEQHDEAEH